MKRKICKRKLKRGCICCNKEIKKGEIYYIERKFIKEFDSIFTCEYIFCCKCNYKTKIRKERYKSFLEKDKCPHKLTNEVWTTMAGEYYVKEPSHTECLVCGKVIYDATTIGVLKKLQK